MTIKKNITGGLYLVLDPSMNRNLLLSRLQEALNAGVQVLQIWNNWPPAFDRNQKKEFIRAVTGMAERYSVPVLINEEWVLVPGSDLAGVHLDNIPEDFSQLRQALPPDAIVGITCGNDLSIVEWAERQQLDYISFCAMFPSSSVDGCEIVAPETVQRARSITGMPLFVSGGIRPENIRLLRDLDISGVAIISGIMNQEVPQEAVTNYTQALKEIIHEGFTAR